MVPYSSASTNSTSRPVSPAMQSGATVQALTGDGIWLRQGTGEGQSVIHAERASLDGTELTGATFLTYGPDGPPVERLTAEAARLTGGAWELTGVKRWPLTAANPDYLEGALETKAYFMGIAPPHTRRAPVAQVAGDSSAVAALEEVSETLRRAREDGRWTQKA